MEVSRIEQKTRSIARRQTTTRSSYQSTVSVVPCQSYDQDQVNQAIDQSLKNIGGLEQLVQPGMRVHIKPNLLTAKSPDRAATTHPSIVRAIVEQVQKLGGEVTIGDSPAGISLPIEDYWRATGMETVAATTGAKLVKFEKKGVVKRIVNGNSYFIATAVANADLVINICKLKTHNLTLFTGAIKNMFGIIPGFKKSEYHKQAPKVEEFSRIVVEIFATVKPQLSIMDAVEIMEGNGPSAGKPRHLGLILAGQDAVAMDALAANILGFEEHEILTTSYAAQLGLGQADLGQIAIVGTSLEPYRGLDFLLPSNRFLKLVPAALVKILGKLVWVRPKPDPDRCQRCGLCIKSCPTRAMTPVDGFPVIDYRACISCFCCDEVCPYDAIDQDMSWLAKMFR